MALVRRGNPVGKATYLGMLFSAILEPSRLEKLKLNEQAVIAGDIEDGEIRAAA